MYLNPKKGFFKGKKIACNALFFNSVLLLNLLVMFVGGEDNLNPGQQVFPVLLRLEASSE